MLEKLIFLALVFMVCYAAIETAHSLHAIIRRYRAKRADKKNAPPSLLPANLKTRAQEAITITIASGPVAYYGLKLIETTIDFYSIAA